jgi:hypothetical protein
VLAPKNVAREALPLVPLGQVCLRPRRLPARATAPVDVRTVVPLGQDAAPVAIVRGARVQGVAGPVVVRDGIAPGLVALAALHPSRCGVRAAHRHPHPLVRFTHTLPQLPRRRIRDTTDGRYVDLPSRGITLAQPRLYCFDRRQERTLSQSAVRRPEPHGTSLFGSGVARGDHAQAASVASSLVNDSSPPCSLREIQSSVRIWPTRPIATRLFGEPVAELESSPSVGLVVELESDPHLERLEALGQLAGDVQDAVEQLAVDDLRRVGVVVDPNVGFVCHDHRPSLVAAGAHVVLDLVARQRTADRAPPRRQVVGVRERLVDERARRVEDARSIRRDQSPQAAEARSEVRFEDVLPVEGAAHHDENRR